MKSPPTNSPASATALGGGGQCLSSQEALKVLIGCHGKDFHSSILPFPSSGQRLLLPRPSKSDTATNGTPCHTALYPSSTSTLPSTSVTSSSSFALGRGAAAFSQHPCFLGKKTKAQQRTSRNGIQDSCHVNMLDKLRQIMNNLIPPSDHVSSNSGYSSYVVEDGPRGSTSAITCQAQTKVSSVQPPFLPLLNSPPAFILLLAHWVTLLLMSSPCYQSQL